MAVGDEIYHVGCDAGYQANGQIGDVVEVMDDLIIFSPQANGGDSGSCIVEFDANGDPYIVGLVAWQIYESGERYGMAMKSHIVKNIIDTESNAGVPESFGLRDNNRILRDLLARLIDLRRDRDRLQKQIEDQHEDAQLFRDRWNKQQEDQLDKQDEQATLIEKLSRKFDNLKILLKWSFYGLVGLLVAALFFKQGWATTVIISIITFFFRTAKLAYLLVHNAIVTKVKNPKTMSEALEDLQDGISEGIGRDKGESSPSN